MMRIRRLFLVTLAIVLLSGCAQNPFAGQTTIDWIDFVKLNGKMYTGFRENVLRNPDDVMVEAIIGEVKFNVVKVSNKNYRTKNGDASYLTKGDKLYRVKGFKEKHLIAAEDDKSIGGYRLYAGESYETNLGLHYGELDMKKVDQVELYRQNSLKPNKTLTGSEMDRFIQLLGSGTDQARYTPELNEGYPITYTMVFYTEGPLGYAFYLFDDGTHVYLEHDQTRLFDQAIRTFLE
ncbi:hypothetical protein [Paenibacillus spongiae]|uniref:DUF3298 domain-containing protein n=1 Tax=Paenibacillus spongiae TaxID=2909671 RepID=A0ABY5SGH3_9BACL|nr:hypothetical protein [Paenibacillus spongiae]UVI32869.1 hypothetical protein L1F29_13995 [Paenibacillus spongiae]